MSISFEIVCGPGAEEQGHEPIDIRVAKPPEHHLLIDIVRNPRRSIGRCNAREWRFVLTKKVALNSKLHVKGRLWRSLLTEKACS